MRGLLPCLALRGRGFFAAITFARLILCIGGNPMLRKLLSLALCLCMALTLTSAVAENTALVVTDMAGREVTLNALPSALWR